MEYQYHLAKRGKTICPKCGQKTFVLYVDENGNALNDGVGKCDRANNCGYHCPPREYLKELETFQRPFHYALVQRPQPMRPQPKPQPSYMNAEMLKQSMCWYDSNNLVKYLTILFGERAVADAVSRYYVGTSNHFGGGAVVFWQVDRCGHIRTGKVMQYNPDNGKRVKKPYNQVTWAHSLLNIDGYNLSQCLFGEHLLTMCQPDEKVFIVESEKTALIMTCILDGGICLATGGCGHINDDLFKPLRGRNVVLFPDNGMFDKWSGLRANLGKFCNTVDISDVMERKAIREGDDIGDLIMASVRNGDVWTDGFDWRDVLV